MKKLLLTSVAALFLATGTAHAEWYDTELANGYDKWTANGHSCLIIKLFRPNDHNVFQTQEGTEGTMVHIQPSEIPDLEKALHNLKLCNKFYDCVAKRDYKRYGTTPDPKGAPKHCYEPRGWKK
jgi:hypothetical protein